MSPGCSAMACATRHGFLAEAAHIEGDLSLALRALHAVVEDAREQHVAQAHLQVLGLEARIPLAHGLVFVVEHAHQSHGHFFHVAGAGIDVGLVDGAGGRQLDVAEVRLVARPRGRLRNVKSWHGADDSAGGKGGKARGTTAARLRRLFQRETDRHEAAHAGFITIRNTAISGAAGRHRSPDAPRLRQRLVFGLVPAAREAGARVGQQFLLQRPDLEARTPAPEMPNNTSDQPIQNVRSNGSPPISASATPVAMMSNTPGTVKHRSLRMMPSIACARTRRSPLQVGMHFPEHAGDDVAEEQHHADDVQRLQRQIEHAS